MLNMRRYSLGMCNFPFRCEAFGNIPFSLWWVKPLVQINGVPVQIEGSWVSLKGVLHRFKETVWLKGVLHMFKEMVWCSNKRATDSFCLVSKAFPSNKWCSFPNRWQLSLKGVLQDFQSNGVTFEHKGQLSFFERRVLHLERIHCIARNNSVSVV